MSFAAFALALVMVLGCAHAKLSLPLGEDVPQRIIDAHAHWDTKPGERAPSAKMLEEFSANGIVGAVVHSSRTGVRPAIKRDGPVRFAVCAALAPPVSAGEVEKGIQQGEYQCMKVYLAYVPRWADDPYYHPFYKMAEKYQLPVVFHTGDPFDKSAPVKYADPLTVDEIALQYPKVNFVIAHIGNPWVQSAAEVVYKDDNVYVDLSALLLGDLSQLNPESVEELVVKPIRWLFLYVENPKKLLFGTDWPLVNIKSYVKAVKKAIPKEHWDDVFYANAARLFKLESR